MDQMSVEARTLLALHALHARKKPKLAVVAREFGIPPGRLRSRLAGHEPTADNGSGHARFGEAQDLALELHIERLDRLGLQPTKSQLLAAANAILICGVETTRAAGFQHRTAKRKVQSVKNQPLTPLSKRWLRR